MGRSPSGVGDSFPRCVSSKSNGSPGPGTCSLLSFLASVVRHARRRFWRKLCGQGSVAQSPISLPGRRKHCPLCSASNAGSRSPGFLPPLLLTCSMFYFRFCCCDTTPSTKSNLGDSGLFALLRVPLKTLALPLGPGWVFCSRELVAEPCPGCPFLSPSPPYPPTSMFGLYRSNGFSL